MKKNEIKDAHESSVLESFVKHSTDSGQIVTIIDKPDPPDAIVTINGNTTWIEITDVFLSHELAESMTTFVAEDKVHKSVSREERIVIEPDAQFSSILKDVILKKYDKQSIGNIYKKYGRGILLVGIINPFSDSKELVKTEKQEIINIVRTKEPRFEKIYLYDVNNHTFSLLYYYKRDHHSTKEQRVDIC